MRHVVARRAALLQRVQQWHTLEVDLVENRVGKDRKITEVREHVRLGIWIDIREDFARLGGTVSMTTAYHEPGTTVGRTSLIQQGLQISRRFTAKRAPGEVGTLGTQGTSAQWRDSCPCPSGRLRHRSLDGVVFTLLSPRCKSDDPGEREMRGWISRLTGELRDPAGFPAGSLRSRCVESCRGTNVRTCPGRYPGVRSSRAGHGRSCASATRPEPPPWLSDPGSPGRAAPSEASDQFSPRRCPSGL